MSAQDVTPEKNNAYVLDSESSTEMARLMLQDRMLNEMIGGLFPERENLNGISDILDIGCGPGGWTLDVALSYPHTRVTGIDISKTMIEFARKQAELLKLKNIHFELGNVLHRPLPFPDASFDLINIRAAIGYVPREKWPLLVRECFRLTRPGGELRLTEGDRPMFTNSPAFETYSGFLTQLLTKMGYGFSVDGFSFGLTPALGRLLHEAGYTETSIKPYVLDLSYGTPFHDVQVQNITVAFKSMQGPLVEQNIETKDAVEQLYNQMLQEMKCKEFCALAYMITICGKKPEGV
jgi:ubiquinone/menaquinone biosynthesis C-methylase UbiE